MHRLAKAKSRMAAIGNLVFSGYSHAGAASWQLIADGSLPGAAIEVTDEKGLVTVGDRRAECGLAFYPGGFVEPEAYVPLAAKLAQRGVFCAIVKEPLSMAVFNVKAADPVIVHYPGIDRWWVGGHSLGGAVAGIWAADNASKVEGVALLAAYSTKDLSAFGNNIALVYGTNDGVVSHDSLSAFEEKLDPSCVHVLAGGNHAGFGDYGERTKNDVATIVANEQQELAAEAIASAMFGR